MERIAKFFVRSLKTFQQIINQNLNLRPGRISNANKQNLLLHINNFSALSLIILAYPIIMYYNLVEFLKQGRQL